MLEDNQYPIFISLKDTTNNQETAEGLYPVFPEDLQRKDVIENLSKHSGSNSIKVLSFFLKADYATVVKLMNRKESFHGKIKTKYFRYDVKVRIINDMRYMQEIERLYQLFDNNRITWVTPCAPYFLRMFNLYVENMQIPEYEQITSLEIDYEEFKPFVYENLIPMWNIRKEQQRMDMPPVYDEDRKLYRHTINGKRLLPDLKYLITDKIAQMQVNSLGDMEIYCKNENAQVWNFYNFSKVTGESQFVVFSNQKKLRNFFGIETISGIRRCVESLGYSQYFEILEITKESVGTTNHNLYCINSMVQDFESNAGRRQRMKITVKVKINDEWKLDVLSYIAEELNYEFPKYDFQITIV